MKKKKITGMLLAAVLTIGMLNGCGSKGLTVSGTMNEIKDFMFVIETPDGAFYSFPRNTEDSSLDLSEIAVGDEVVIEYEGTLSEVDRFTGKVLSVEKE